MDMLWCYLPLVLSGILIFRFLLHSRRNLPPSPYALPIIGHLYLLLRKKPVYQLLESLSFQYGPILNLQFGVSSIIVVSSPSAVEECFTKNDVIFANRPRTLAGDRLTYDYTAFVWAPYGDLWRTLRRFCVNEILSSNSLQKSSAIREEETCNLARQLYRVSRNSRQKVELTFHFYLLAFNFMFKTVAGKRCFEEGTASLEMGKQHLKELREKFFPGLSMSLCDFLPILRWFGYKGLEKVLVKVHHSRDEFLQNLINEARQNEGCESSLRSNAEVKPEKKTTLIQACMSLQKSEPDFYSDNVIKSIILMMFVAGTDTTAITMEWAMSLLLNHQEMLKKVRLEIDNHVGCARLLHDLDLAKLPYLRCVINETLRLYPPVPLLLPHFSSDKCTLGGYEVPGQSTLLVNAWALHRDPRTWEEPAKFKPERFESIEGERDGSKFIPFGMGRRACPGSGMAIRAASLTLGVMIQCFDWDTVGQKVDMMLGTGAGLNLAKAEPLVAVCSPRQDFVKLLSQL